MVSPLENAVAFLESFGFLNLFLAFRRFFTIVFGILEKTKIFGIEKVGGKEVAKKNLNAMVAFAIAFFVITASQIVQVIRTALPSIVLLLVILIVLLLLIGVFFGDEQFKMYEKFKKTTGFFIVVIIVAIIAIFLNAFGYLKGIVNYLSGSSSGGVLLSSLIFLIIIIAAIVYVIGGKKKEEK